VGVGLRCATGAATCRRITAGFGSPPTTRTTQSDNNTAGPASTPVLRGRLGEGRVISSARRCNRVTFPISDERMFSTGVGASFVTVESTAPWSYGENSQRVRETAETVPRDRRRFCDFGDRDAVGRLAQRSARALGAGVGGMGGRRRGESPGRRQQESTRCSDLWWAVRFYHGDAGGSSARVARRR